MSIQRVPEVPFAQIANSALRDARLSFKARGVLALVLSNAGEWNATLRWLESQSDHDGRAALQAALNELTELGYRVVSREQGEPGGDIRTIVTWHHVPERAETRPTGNPTVGESDHRETGASIEHHPSEHYLEEHQENTLPAVAETHEPDGFDQFWKVYPRKEAKGAGRRAWKTATKKLDPASLIVAATEYRQWCDAEGMEKRFIKHPSSWLNGECWLDERTSHRAPKSSSMTAIEAFAQRVSEGNR